MMWRFGDDYISGNDGAIGGKAMHDRSDVQGKSRPPCEKINLHELKCLELRRTITPPIKLNATYGQ